MNKAGGFITLHRQILDWEWFENSETLHLFIFLLLSANFVDGNFKGRLVRRGQLVTSLPKISTGTGLSIQQTRTALEHLKSTGEITDESSSQYRVITIVKYDQYQKLTDDSTVNQQATNRRSNRQSTDDLTGNQQQYNNNNNINKVTNKQDNNSSLKRRETFTPPTIDDIERYCDEVGIYGFDAQHFIDYYERTNWTLKGGQKIRSWKACIRTWLHNDEQRRKKERAECDDLPY